MVLQAIPNKGDSYWIYQVGVAETTSKSFCFGFGTYHDLPISCIHVDLRNHLFELNIPHVFVNDQRPFLLVFYTHTDNISDYLHADMITTNKTSPIHRFFAGHGNPLMTRFTTCLISRCTILVSMYVIYIYIAHRHTHTQHLWYIHIYLYMNTSPLMSPHIKYSPRNPGWVLGLFIFWYLGEGIIPIFSG